MNTAPITSINNLFTILLRGRDRGSSAAHNAHVLKYIPLVALLFTPLTTARYRS
jgi:hypothetical protein